MDTKIGELIVSKIERLEARMDRLETKIDCLEIKIGDLETRMSNLEEESGKTRTEMRRSFWELEDGLRFVGNRVWDDHEERIKILEFSRV